MRKTIFVSMVAYVMFFTGCVQIPQAAIDVNRQVSTGISSLGDNGQEMVRAWEETAYMVLDEKWGQIYKKAESAYRSKKGIAAGTTLSAQQREDVAGVATLVRDEIRKKIRAEADNMRSIISSNTKSTLEANESITNLLISANAVTSMQQSAIKQVGTLIPIPPAISTFVNSAITAAGL